MGSRRGGWGQGRGPFHQSQPVPSRLNFRDVCDDINQGV